MKELLYLLLFLFLNSCSINNNKQHVIVKGKIIETKWVPYLRGYWKVKANYEYYYNDSIYFNSIMLGKNDTRYQEGDSILLKINIKKEDKPIILRSFYDKKKNVSLNVESTKNESHRKENLKNEIVLISTKQENLLRGYSYYKIDNKPLFGNAYDASMNDSLLINYIYEKHKKDNVDYITGIAINIVINVEGKIVVVKFFDKISKDYELYLKSIFYNMPNWQPGMHNEEIIPVSYNIHFK